MGDGGGASKMLHAFMLHVFDQLILYIIICILTPLIFFKCMMY